MFGPYLIKCHACAKTYAWTPIERACTFCHAPSRQDDHLPPGTPREKTPRLSDVKAMFLRIKDQV
jgi:hypothetical protein